MEKMIHNKPITDAYLEETFGKGFKKFICGNAILVEGTDCMTYYLLKKQNILVKVPAFSEVCFKNRKTPILVEEDIIYNEKSDIKSFCLKYNVFVNSDDSKLKAIERLQMEKSLLEKQYKKEWDIISNTINNIQKQTID